MMSTIANTRDTKTPIWSRIFVTLKAYEEAPDHDPIEQAV